MPNFSFRKFQKGFRVVMMKSFDAWVVEHLDVFFDCALAKVVIFTASQTVTEPGELVERGGASDDVCAIHIGVFGLFKF